MSCNSLCYSVSNPSPSTFCDGTYKHKQSLRTFNTQALCCTLAKERLTCCASSSVTALSPHSVLLMRDTPSDIQWSSEMFESLTKMIRTQMTAKLYWLPDMILSQNGEYLVPIRSVLISRKKSLNTAGSEC